MSRRLAEPEAAYQVVARELRTAILQGRYRDGIQLPTEAELAGHYGVSRQTVRRAFHDLVSEGMVYRVPGRGTFASVRDGRYLRQIGSVEDLMSLSVDTKMEVVTPLQRRVDVDAAGRLHLTADAVHTVVFRRLHEGIPFSITTVFLPPQIAALLANTPEVAAAGATSDATIIGLLEPFLIEPIAQAEQSITAAPASAAVAASLGCAVGDAVLRIDRLYMTITEVPVELSVSYFLPEHYSYRVRLRRTLH